MEWIKVSDRMPDISRVNLEYGWAVSDDVLCYIESEDTYFVARWSEKEDKKTLFWNPVGRNGVSYSQCVTHWMPIIKVLKLKPTPPKE